MRRSKRPFRVRLGPVAPHLGERFVLRFQRSWKVLIIVLGLCAAMTVPAVSVFRQALQGWQEFDGLFDLVAALFSSFWLMGWSVGLVLIWSITALSLEGREVLLIRDGEMELLLGIPGIGVSAVYPLARMRNLRREIPKKDSGHSWRGPHAAMDHANDDIRFGSNLSESFVSRLEDQLELAYGRPLRVGPATNEDRDATAPEPPPQVEPAPVVEPMAAASEPPTLTSPSTLALIGANLLPVVGTLLFGWNLGDVMLLYWAESGVIGLYNIAKMCVVGRWGGLVTSVFFAGHYGAFMAGHLLFLWSFFVRGLGDQGADDLNLALATFASLWPALAALFLSHGVSFFVNFLGRKEYVGRKLGKQMAEPYKRIVIMQVTIIFGGILTMVLGDATPVLLLLITLKIFADVRGHLKERK